MHMHNGTCNNKNNKKDDDDNDKIKIKNRNRNRNRHQPLGGGGLPHLRVAGFCRKL